MSAGNAAALVLVLPLLARGQAAPEPVFHSTRTLQSVPVRVVDGSGRDVDGLTASDFTLLENGRAQKLAFFGAERMPVSLAVLLDTSRSMDLGGKLKRAQALLAPLVPVVGIGGARHVARRFLTPSPPRSATCAVRAIPCRRS
jgi:hypothetical protein